MRSKAAFPPPCVMLEVPCMLLMPGGLSPPLGSPRFREGQSLRARGRGPGGPPALQAEGRGSMDPTANSHPKFITNPAKIHHNSRPNPSKINQKTVPNPSKIGRKSSSGPFSLPRTVFSRFWVPPERFLAPSWRVLGAKWSQVGLQN